MKDLRGLDPATIAAHGVRAPSPETLPEGQRAVPASEPLYLTSVMHFDSVDASLLPMDEKGGYVYARHGLPNGRSFEATVAALEGAEAGVATSSGSAALGALVWAVVSAGDRVLLQQDAYGGTGALLLNEFARFGVQIDKVDAYAPAAVAAALEQPAKLLIVETLSNPLIRAVDVGALAALCRSRGVLLVVDNTFATPVFSRPLQAGADVVFHSATKFLGGHHDLCAGVVCGPAELIEKVRGVTRRFGCTISPMDAWLASRGVKTLGVRMERSQTTARALAARLRAHPGVAAVHYPGLGAILSFDVGSYEAANRAVSGLGLISLTPSLGGVTTGVSHSASSSHRSLERSAREALGIGDGLLRLSVGLEAEADLWADLQAAIGPPGR